MTVHFRKSFVADLGALAPLYRERIERTILALESGKYHARSAAAQEIEGTSWLFPNPSWRLPRGIGDGWRGANVSPVFESQRILSAFPLRWQLLLNHIR
jgi:hypothetical protein